jgi:hypothetical protein
MESGAKGCEVCVLPFCQAKSVQFLSELILDMKIDLPFGVLQVIVSGKLRAQRAKSMKFKDGYMISSGHPVNLYIDSAVRHVLLRQVCFLFDAIGYI